MGKSLGSDSVECVVQNQWLIQVQIEPKGDSSDEPLTLLVSPDVTVAELKAIIHERLGVHPKEQRLYDTDGVPLFFGRIASHDTARASSEQSVGIHWERVKLDPRLEALYEMTGYGNVNERDEITFKMLTPRLAKRCSSGHEWIFQGYNRDDGTAIMIEDCEKYACAICAWQHTPGEHTTCYINNGERIVLKPFVCECANFAFCTKCWTKDSGRNPREGDPHDFIESMAIQVGRRMAGTAAWFGGKGHMCGHPVIWVNP